MPENNDNSHGTWFVSCEDLFISPDGLLRIPHPNAQAEARLVCFPPAGAEAFMYDGWVTSLPESIELCAVQLPEQKQEVSQVIAELAESLLQHTRKGQKLFFIGLCLGAIWAVEVARYLRDHAGLQPEHMVVVTYPAPDQRESSVAFMRTQAFLQIMTSYFPPDSPEYHYVLSRLPAMQHAADLADQPLAPMDTPLDCSLTAFASLHDQVINPQLLQSWQPYTSGHFSVHMCDGDHFYGDLHREEFLQAVVGYLQGDRSRIHV
jgi:medium-chain acyl-[acyl-carrier-protein] hydrolase